MKINENNILKTAFNLPPQKAVEYFKSKGYRISFDCDEMKREAHTKAFTVSGVTKIDMLVDIRNAISDAKEKGKSLESFKKDFIPLLQKKGWHGRKVISRPDGSKKEVDLSAPWRIKTIYNTNLNTAYQAGIYKDLKDNTDVMPYWRYVAVMDGRTRDAHRQLNDKIIAANDPFWDRYFPPNGWGCRCTVIGVTKRQADREKSNLAKGNVLSREISPHVPDGWDYNPGQSFWEPDKTKYPDWAKEKLDEVVKQAKQLEKPSKLSFNEAKAVNSYLSPKSYVLNEKLRYGQNLTSSDKTTIERLDAVLKKQPKYEGAVSRSLYFVNKNAQDKFIASLEPGEIVENKQYLSATSGSSYNPDAQVQIHIISKNGRDIREFNPGEQEILYERNFKFKVVSINKTDDTYHIQMDEVTQDE